MCNPIFKFLFLFFVWLDFKSSVFWAYRHIGRWSLAWLQWPGRLFSPFSSWPHHPITFNYWGEDAQSTLAIGSVSGIAGSRVGDGELESNRAGMCGLWMTSSGARGEPLSVYSTSRAELAPWSTNQFGEEGKMNSGSPTWSRGGNAFLPVLIICCLCEIDANMKSEEPICVMVSCYCCAVIHETQPRCFSAFVERKSPSDSW